MREIKFRAWDKELQFMVDPSCYMVGMNGGAVFDNYGDFYEQLDKLELMQYTGLKDKNWNEIYEGDVVIDHVGIGEVEYIERHAAFRVNYKNGKAKWFMDYILNGERESIEVLGNIYENTELMEEQP